MQEAALNEVFTGGLSSYSVVNMVMAHLQSVGYPLPTLPDVSTPAEPSSHPTVGVSQLGGADAHLHDATACEEDVGELLLGFLQCFGCQFDYSQQAVSVREVLTTLQKPCKFSALTPMYSICECCAFNQQPNADSMQKLTHGCAIACLSTMLVCILGWRLVKHGRKITLTIGFRPHQSLI